MANESFSIKIQPGALDERETQVFLRHLKKYIEKHKVPPQMSGLKPGSTLSNCSDNPGGTECTCQVDD